MDNSALEKLSASFFARAGKSKDDTLLLEDFIFVLNSRPEICQSIQFGGLDLGASDPNGDVDNGTVGLPFCERASLRILQALRVSDLTAKTDYDSRLNAADTPICRHCNCHQKQRMYDCLALRCSR